MNLPLLPMFTSKSLPLALTAGLALFAAGSIAAEPPDQAEHHPKGEYPWVQPTNYVPGSLVQQQYRWEQVQGESLALVGPFGVVWKLNFGARLTKPYFHPLATADGRTLTWIAPADHPWHYGLWHSWKLIDGVNYWEEDKQTGRSDGTTEVVSADVKAVDDRGAHVVLQLAYYPATKKQQVVMQDRIELTIGVPAKDGSYSIEWRQTTTATEAPVVLGRTPIPSDPGGQSWGGYAGLGYRGSRFLRNATVLASTGATGMAAHRKPAAWMSMTGQLEGRPASISMFDHPSNPRHPTPWFVELQDKDPFWYFNAAFLHDKPFTVTPGKPLVRRYLVRVDNRTLSSAQLADMFQTFASKSAQNSPKS